MPGDALHAYLRAVLGVRPGTARAYVQDAERFRAFLARAGVELGSVGVEVIEGYVAGLSGSYRNRTLRSLRLYFDFLKQQGAGFAVNPALGVPRVVVPPRGSPLSRANFTTLVRIATERLQAERGQASVQGGSQEAARLLGLLSLLGEVGLSLEQARALRLVDVVDERARPPERRPRVRLRIACAASETLKFAVGGPAKRILQMSFAAGKVAATLDLAESEAPLLMVLRGPRKGGVLSVRSAHHALQQLALAAGIKKPVTPTALRRLARRA